MAGIFSTECSFVKSSAGGAIGNLASIVIFLMLSSCQDNCSNSQELFIKQAKRVINKSDSKKYSFILTDKGNFMNVEFVPPPGTMGGGYLVQVEKVSCRARLLETYQ